MERTGRRIEPLGKGQASRMAVSRLSKWVESAEVDVRKMQEVDSRDDRTGPVARLKMLALGN